MMSITDTYNRAMGVLHLIANRAAQTAAYPSWPDDFSRSEITESWDNKAVKPPFDQFTIKEFRSLSMDQRAALGFRNWDDELTLIPLYIVRHIKAGEHVKDINGETSTIDDADLDVRGGCIAFGFEG